VHGGEARHHCLEDTDWEKEIVCIRRPKQRKSQHYPLVREVGATSLRYLREVQPKCKLIAATDARHHYRWLLEPHTVRTLLLLLCEGKLFLQ